MNCAAKQFLRKLERDTIALQARPGGDWCDCRASGDLMCSCTPSACDVVARWHPDERNQFCFILSGMTDFEMGQWLGLNGSSRSILYERLGVAPTDDPTPESEADVLAAAMRGCATDEYDYPGRPTWRVLTNQEVRFVLEVVDSGPGPGPSIVDAPSAYVAEWLANYWGVHEADREVYRVGYERSRYALEWLENHREETGLDHPTLDEVVYFVYG